MFFVYNIIMVIATTLASSYSINKTAIHIHLITTAIITDYQIYMMFNNVGVLCIYLIMNNSFIPDICIAPL